MACCNQNAGTKIAVCEVCRLLDGDTVLKRCRYCTACKAWICEKDWRNLARRAMAMLTGVA